MRRRQQAPKDQLARERLSRGILERLAQLRSDFEALRLHLPFLDSAGLERASRNNFDSLERQSREIRDLTLDQRKKDGRHESP